MNLFSIKKFVYQMLALILIFPFFGVLVAILVGEENEALIIAFVSPYLIYFMSLGIRAWYVKCPRCSNTFFRDGIWFGSLFRCNYCRLSIFDSHKESENKNGTTQT